MESYWFLPDVTKISICCRYLLATTALKNVCHHQAKNTSQKH